MRTLAIISGTFHAVAPQRLQGLGFREYSAIFPEILAMQALPQRLEPVIVERSFMRKLSGNGFF